MIKTIHNIDDVKAFADYLVNVEKVNFHPDDDFKDYINYKTKEATYTEKDAQERNRLMDECFKICEKEGVDIYEIMGDSLSKFVEKSCAN